MPAFRKQQKTTFLAEEMIEVARQGDVHKLAHMLDRANTNLVGMGPYAGRPHPNPIACYLDGYKHTLGQPTAECARLLINKIPRDYDKVQHIHQMARYAVACGAAEHLRAVLERWGAHFKSHDVFADVCEYGHISCIELMLDRDGGALLDVREGARMSAKHGRLKAMAWWLNTDTFGAHDLGAADLRFVMLRQVAQSRLNMPAGLEILYDFQTAQRVLDDLQQSGASERINPGLLKLHSAQQERKILVAATSDALNNQMSRMGRKI